ncbi:uncharacterized protein LOC128244982 isoform X2 [Mya arenaria]|uniref:uncharacterized protein LOC128244982 isoform X2 n=1 Tax=Mya arenaria TaxID=6604 RepID=UPI0022E4FC6E|nr:uncharacterized protein LOC128244982 isoform X2 [Mya arenaria]
MHCAHVIVSCVVLTNILDYVDIIAAEGDPCLDPTTRDLGFLRERFVGYKAGADEDAICDYYLEEAWYKMEQYVVASSDQSCGTDFNWYRKGNLPETPNVVENIVLCRNGLDGPCDITRNGQAMLCQDGTYVFFLPYVLSCPEAYCIEHPVGKAKTEKDGGIIPSITSINPNIDVTVVPKGETHELEFHCDFLPVPDTEYFYTVQYARTTGDTWTNQLLETQPTKHIDQKGFREETKLTETHLKTKQMGLGITIACSVTASLTKISDQSGPRISPNKFIGIEHVNKTSHITLNDQQTATIYLRHTVPFGCRGDSACFLDIIVFIPREKGIDTCHTSDIGQLEGDRNKCGTRLMSNKVDELTPITVECLQGGNRLKESQEMHIYLRTHDSYPIHPFFANYALEPIKVHLHTDRTFLTDKDCYSYNDPHMKSFDGLRYENQNPGTFIFYRHTERPQEVQIKTKRCWGHSGPFCNCGVAVRAGRDVYVVDMCDGQPDSGRFRECKDKVIFTKLVKLPGSNSEIIMPTGTKVVISFQHVLLNVRIYPSIADHMLSEGLCGNFDGTTQNDRAHRKSSTASDPNLSWIVNSDEDLFNEGNDETLAAWTEKQKLCTCKDRFGGNGPSPFVTCSADTTKICNFKPNTNSRCSSISKRRKRDGSIHHKMEMDFYRSVKTAFVSKRPRVERDWPRSMVKRSADEPYNNVTAFEDCMKIINTTAFQKCKDIPSLNFDSIISDCVLDAIASNSMDWTAQHLESIKTKCVHEVKAEQLPPPEALEGVTIEINGVEYSNITEENVTLPVTQEFSPVILEEIENVVCTNECSERGVCVNGTCVCNKPYIGEDCSVDSTSPPEMLGIPDEGICDLQVRACKRVYVIARHLVDTSNLTCILTPFVVTTDAKNVTVFEQVVVPAELETFLEASCELPEVRVKRSTIFLPNDVIATGYLVALSNDGVTFSEEDTLALFDSDCVECEKVKGDLFCRRKPGFCVTNSQCYQHNETIDCLRCTGQPDEILSWQPDCEETEATEKTEETETTEKNEGTETTEKNEGTETTEKTEETETTEKTEETDKRKINVDGEDKKTWLIPAILTPIIVFGIVVVVLIVRFKTKKESFNFAPVEMNPIDE